MSPHPPHIMPATMSQTPGQHGAVVMHPAQQPTQILMPYGQPNTAANGGGPPITPVLGATPFPPLTSAFLQPGISPQNLAQVVHSSSVNQAFTTGLASAIQSLLYAATTLNAQNADNPGGAMEAIIDLLKRYKAMLPHLPVSLSHFGCGGPQAGVKALRVALRKNATWISYSASGSAFSPPSPNNPGTPSAVSRRPELPIHDQMHRTSVDRFRRKEYFIWAMIHSASYEVGLLGPTKNSMELGYPHDQVDDDDGSMKLAESVAKDGFWETDESDWVSGALLFRAVVRRTVEDPTMSVMNMKQEWEELVRAYEARWKDMRDESRQQALEVFFFIEYFFWYGITKKSSRMLLTLFALPSTPSVDARPKTIPILASYYKSPLSLGSRPSLSFSTNSNLYHARIFLIDGYPKPFLVYVLSISQLSGQLGLGLGLPRS
jgi:hypothetical protein